MCKQQGSSWRRLALGMGMLALAPVAFAQEAAPPADPGETAATAEVAAPESEAPTNLDTIIVTGQRTPLYVVRDVTAGALGARDSLDLPFSLTGYDQTLIQTQRATTLNELLRNDPSVQNFNFGGNYDFIAIRGFEASTTSSFRRDGLQTITLTDIPYENAERVEVLKGVSGFLFGFTQPGGTVNYVLKRPTRERFASLSTELRDNDGVYAHADLGGPVGRSGLGYRLNAAYEKQGDFSQFRDVERSIVSLALDYKPLEQLLLRVDADYQDKQLAAQPQIPLDDAGRIPEGFDPYNLFGVPWLTYDTRATNASLRADWQIAPNVSLTSQFNSASVERDAAFPFFDSLEADGDYEVGLSLGPARTQNFDAVSQQTFVTFELRAGRLAHTLVGGVYTSRLEGISCGYFADVPTYTGNLRDPVHPTNPGRDAFGEVPPGDACPQVTDQTHVYASDTISLGERWRAILGLRYVDYDASSSGAFVSAFKERVTTPTYALLFKPLPSATLYVSYAESLEEGGAASEEDDNFPATLPPLKAEQWELGAKAEVLRGLNLATALFRIERPADYVDPASNRFGRFGEQTHTGLEFTASGAAARGLFVVGGFTWLNPELSKNQDPAVDGKRVTGVAELQASIFADWRLPKLPAVNVFGGVYHVGERAFDTANTLDVGSYTRLDLGAGYTTRAFGEGFSVQLNVDNVTDEFFYESVAYGGLTPGIPRVLKLTATLEL